MTIQELMAEAYRISKSKGFHTGKPDIWKFVGNLHGECSEAWEEARKPDFKPSRIYYREVDKGPSKPEGLPIELADIVIRVADTAATYGIDLEKAIRMKMAYNETRPHRHGGKRA